MRYYILTDGNIDDIQAIVYLSNKISIDGIIIETGVPDICDSISNIVKIVDIMNINTKLYFGNLSNVNVPDEWRKEAKYANRILRRYSERICSEIGNFMTIDFNFSTIISLGKATSLLFILENFKISTFYAFLGGNINKYNQPENGKIDYEINALMDISSYRKVIEYDGYIFGLESVTYRRIEYARQYVYTNPILFEIIPYHRKNDWRYWDLVMVMYYF